MATAYSVLFCLSTQAQDLKSETSMSSFIRLRGPPDPHTPHVKNPDPADLKFNLFINVYTYLGGILHSSIHLQNTTSMITLTDMFCGCGGSSEGARNVAGTHIQYALNHWKLAIESHNTNHPDTHHDCADISETHPARYQKTTGLIASPECTNHSLAKGQKRKNLHQQDIFQDKAFDASAVRSRATMWDVPRFAEIHKYEFVITENVVDVRMWVMFDPWLKAMHALGYLHECVYLNAMFAHGEDINGFAPQSRDRIYIVFWKKGNRKPDLDIRPKAPCPRCGTVEAIQTWKPGRRSGKYKTQYTYRCSVCATPVLPFYYAALNALDLSIPMIRIGDRASRGMQPLSPNTQKRIQYGLDKYGIRPTIIDQRNQSGSASARIRGAETDPLNAQSTGYSSYLFAPFLFNMAHTKAKNPTMRGMDEPMVTQTTQESLAMVSPQPFLLANRDCSPAKALTDVIHTQTTANQEILIAPPGSFIVTNRKTTPARDPNAPLATITGQPNSMSFIVPIHGTARAKSSNEPMETVMTTGHSSLIMMPYHGQPQANHAFEVCSTVPTKDSIALIDGKPEIDDCYFRMLQPAETARAQGFPVNYAILGNKSEKQKQIGNANPPPTMELLVARCVASLL
ncbi:DNA cytosine methyltransferase [Spirosoma sp. KCTC 42546]|uniref:DNA cytosine methyltransferase n=1 Tax=Spirosoma sp. KCTC 42546 TaxID=2520506 RepID=UPI00115819BE|nr:DNA cytosine methyltransferase [Spirosoma sp. KCTC 42546]QDK80865.1 DNA cytosine methyltransferase [Spirosoma sp. KCTC 42546]